MALMAVQKGCCKAEQSVESLASAASVLNFACSFQCGQAGNVSQKVIRLLCIMSDLLVAIAPCHTLYTYSTAFLLST